MEMFNKFTFRLSSFKRLGVEKHCLKPTPYRSKTYEEKKRKEKKRKEKKRKGRGRKRLSTSVLLKNTNRQKEIIIL